MFVITMVFLAGLLLSVQQGLLQYSAVDMRSALSSNDFFLLENIRNVMDITVKNAESCTALKEEIDELEKFMENSLIVSEYFVNIEHEINCNNWYNTPDTGPSPLKLIIKISGEKTQTQAAFYLYHE